MNIIKLIKILIAVCVVLAGAEIYFSFRAAQTGSERSRVYVVQRVFTLAGHEFRTASLEMTRAVRAYVVMGNELQLEQYWEYLLVADRLGAIRRTFIDNEASPYEVYLLDRALAYQEKLRAMDAEAIAARTAGNYELALNITYSPYYTAYGIAFVALLNRLKHSTFARTQEKVDNAERNALFFQNLSLATTLLFGIFSILALVFIMYRAKKAIQKEREAHALTQTIIDSAPFVITLWNENYNLVTVSQQAVKMFGVSEPDKMIGYMPHTISPEFQPCGTPTMEKARQCIGKAYSEGYSRFEWMHQTADGEPLPVEITAKRFHHGGKDMLVSYTVDMREMKAAMEKEREAHELAQTILESAPFVIALWDNNYNVVTAGKQAANVLKISDSQELIGNNIFNFCPACQPCGTPTLKKARQCLGKAYSEGYSQFEWMFQTADGEPLPVEVFTKRFNRNGKDMLVSYAIDLREMKAAIEKEREAHEMNEILLRSAPFVINIWDDNYNFISTNEQAVGMFGVSSKEQFIERFFDLSPPQQPCGANSKERIIENIDQLFQEGKRVQFEWMHQTLSGEPLPAEITLARFKQQGRYMLAAYTIDVRPIKAAEELTRKLLDNSPLFMEFWDEDNNLLDCNKRMIEIFETSSKEEYIKRFYDFSAPYQPCGTTAEEKNKAMIKCAVEKGRSRSEWMFILPSGEELPTEATWVYIIHQGKPMIIVYSQDLRPIKQETQRMLAEMQRRELAEEESLAKTRFLARMSHEIRTPMNAVLGITGVQLQKKLPAEIEEAFYRIHSSSKSLLTIVNEILDLSKVEAGKMEINPEPYKLADMLVDTVQQNTVYIGNKKIEFKLEIEEQLFSHLIGDEFRVQQILSNLLSNAFKYTSEGLVVLSVKTESGPSDDSVILVLRVQDTGQGMSKEQVAHLFDGFTRFNLSLNRNIVGSGLGMTIAHYLLELMGGKMEVESEVGRGSVITAHIPQKLARNTTLGKETAEKLQNFETFQQSRRMISNFSRVPMPYGRVLIVDDVETNLYVAKEILGPYKIAVETATNGRNAVEKIKNGEVYDIIFMDHMMPDMDGIAATRIIRDLGYEHPIVALTANALEGVEEIFLINGFSEFISKPIELNQFNACLMRYIHDKQPPEVLEAAKKHSAETEGIGNLPDNLQKLFLIDARQAVDTLEPLTRKEKLNKEELKNFTIQAHAMKSTLYNIGQPELSKAASVLETAGRTADMKTIKASAPQFLNDLREIMKGVLPEETASIDDDEAEHKVANKTIFLVDDSMINLMMGKNLLSDRYNVHTCNSGAAMFNLLGKITPDLILLDVEMPEMDGYEALKRLKDSQDTADIPVFFVTAHNIEEIESKGRSLGAIDFIAKPFVPQLLLERIETHLQAAKED